MSEYVFRYAHGFGGELDECDHTDNVDHFGTLHEEIVRCRDCAYSIHFLHHDNERWQCTEPYQEGVGVKPNAYCWRGRRKEGK